MRRPTAYRWAFRKAFRSSDRARLNIHHELNEKEKESLNNANKVTVFLALIVTAAIYISILAFIFWLISNGGAVLVLLALIVLWVFS